MSKDEQSPKEISTDGGTYIEGSVDTGGGEVVGRDQVKIGRVIGDIVFGNADAERSRREARNRQVMIQKVRSFWVKGVLEQSLYQVARIELGLTERSDAIEHPWDMIVQQPDREPWQLALGTRMIDIYDELGGALLILGAPGSGKTTLLLEMARDLLDRAEQDSGHPIPIVLNLSSWAANRKPLAEWLVDELSQRYDVPRKVGQVWVQGDQILSLLDGLDEVAQEHREACVEAINAHRREHGLVPMVVCSRRAEYGALAARLRMLGAVSIQPITHERVDKYLADSGQLLAGVREALQADKTLYELFDTPLMLSIAALAYRDTPSHRPQMMEDLASRREHLFAVYVESMFRRRSRKGTYTRHQVEHWLGWLSSKMLQHSQSVFTVETMQPSWLGTGSDSSLYLLMARLVLGISLAVPLGLLGIVVGIATRTATGGWIVTGLLMGFSAGFRHSRPRDTIDLADRLYWSWQGAGRGLLRGLGCGLVTGVIGAGAILFLVLKTNDGQSWEKAQPMLGVLLVYALIPIVAFTLVWGLKKQAAVTQMQTRRRVHGSLRSALAVSLLAPLPMGAIFGLAGSLTGHSVYALTFGVLGGIVGLMTGLFFGGREVGHYAALRLVLWRSGSVPLNYTSLLDYATERIFLRKVGGGYIFVHRLLQDHFASLWENEHPSSP